MTGNDSAVTRPAQTRLEHALEPIRHFVLAQVIHLFLASGLQEHLGRAGRTPVDDAARHLGMDRGRLLGVLRYLSNEDLVRLADDHVELTRAGHEIAEFRAWYRLLVGGYGTTMLQLGDVLADGDRYAGRDGAAVGEGSCGISRFDALPMTRELLDRLDGPVGTVVDLGCGDAAFLAELCAQAPSMRGIGIEPAPEVVAAGNAMLAERGLAGRVRVEKGSATDPVDRPDAPQGRLCFLTAFVLQEVLEQQGRERVVRMLNEQLLTHPDACWVVIEVDHRPDDPVMTSGLGRSYYNPYFLIHEITEQRLETRAFWEDVFLEAGLQIIGRTTTDPSYDSLGLKMGYLLGATDPL